MKRLRNGVALVTAAATLAITWAPVASASGRPPCLVSDEATGTGHHSLQAAIDAGGAGAILLLKGTCAGASTVPRDLTIRGRSNKPFGAATLDGEWSGTVLTIEAGVSVTVEDVTITRGEGSGAHGAGGVVNHGRLSGGGITNQGTLVLQDSAVTHNASLYGGGVVNEGVAHLVRSLVADNEAGREGGGILNGSYLGSAVGPLTLTDSVIRDNHAYYGGGIHGPGVVTIVGTTTIGGNSALSGDGIYNAGTVTGVTGGTFTPPNTPDDCVGC